MALIILSVLILTKTFNLVDIRTSQSVWFALIIPAVAVIWFITCLAETNRAPFDLAEGESELVRGFNIEYSGGEFAFLFIAEYGSILLIRVMTIILFISGIGSSSLSIIKLLRISYLFLWVRGAYPRIRYDALMNLT